jgi:hypothetical protein
MNFRLGEYTCQHCGHLESREFDKQEAKGLSGPGFQQDGRWTGSRNRSSAAAGPAPPPPGTLYRPGQLAGGQYSDLSKSEAPPIATHEYILAGCLGFVIPIVGVAFASSWARKGRPGSETCLPMAWLWFGLNVVLLIIGALIGDR